MSPPVGTITFLFTDIEGSTHLWEAQPDLMRAALARHDSLLRQSIEARNGFVFKTVGDAFYAAFADPTEALNAALTAQIQLNHGEHGEHGEEQENRRIHGIHGKKEQKTEKADSSSLDSSVYSVYSAVQLKVRMALHTGTAEMRDSDYFGPPLNRVARLLAAGHGGQILLSDAIYPMVASRLPEGVTLLALGRHPLKDLPEPTAIWQVQHPELKSDFPPLRSLPTSVHHLPQALTSFFGRERETAEAEARLRQPGVRLVTLTGFGGMGKTRLAMQVAQQSLLAFPDGVWWLEMEEATSGEAMFARIAERLRLPIQGEASVREQVRLALREKSLLLALDNLEQIPDAAEALRDLLTGTTALKCLITSRRALQLRGERVMELDPLPATDAEQLFVARVQEVNADFAATDANREDIARLCRKLESIPLAIELAAARGASLTPRQMHDRLNERFRLLQSRSPDLPPRQRALSAAIQWSYCLLEEEERSVLAQLSVFAGGFALEDAEAVCEAFDVFESVEILRRHSFFRAETDPERQQTRFLMLDSVREYAVNCLNETEDGDATFRHRHAAHFLARAQTCLAQLRTGGETEALVALEADADNFYAAETWAREQNSLPTSAEMALALGRWRWRRGFGRQSVTFVENGLAALNGAEGSFPDLKAALLRERAGLHLDSSELDEARARAQEASDISAAQGDTIGQAQAENLFGLIAMRAQDFGEAQLRFESALEAFTRAELPVEIANVHNNLGLLARRGASDLDKDSRSRRAETHLNEALRLRREQEDRRGLAETLNNLGLVAFERSDFVEAERYYTQALDYERELRNVTSIALLLANLGEVAQLQSDPARAARLFAVSEAFLDEAGSSFLSPVAAMTEAAATESGLDPEVVAQLRVRARSLAFDPRVTFALDATPVPEK